MKMSKLFMPTLRELPAEAQAPSHILMLRAALVRQMTAGIYAYLPLGYRVLRKIERIVREEMDRAGAQEMLMPALLGADIYKQSGRWEVFGDEMFRLRDRSGRDFCLGPTHEELFAEAARSVLRSYKAMPLTLYQIQTKFRDEIRPRYGVVRAREFVMKDAYSFDTDDAGLDVSYRAMYDAYVRVFDRLSLSFSAVDADTGAMGGSGSQEFMVNAGIGEDTLARCADCGYGANTETAVYAPAQAAGDIQAGIPPMEAVYTPGIHTIAEVCAFFDLDADRIAKTMICVADDRPVAVMLRGERALCEAKLARLLGASSVEVADAAIVEEITGAAVGYAGPVGLSVPVYADEELRGAQSLVIGANRTEYHYKNVLPGRDFAFPVYADLGLVKEGDRCARCGGTLSISRGLEVGHIFKLGRKYTQALGILYTDEQGQEHPPVMGSYGIGVSRLMAAVIEQHHDADGIVWPDCIAPYQAVIVSLARPGSEGEQIAQKLYDTLTARGAEVLLDDRNERAGVKFKDADLIGIPIRITVGRRAEEGIFEVKRRGESTARELTAPETVGEVCRFMENIRG